MIGRRSLTRSSLVVVSAQSWRIPVKSKVLTINVEQEEGNVKYMLFSATFPAPIRKLAKTHMAESHVRIRVGRIGSTHENIKQDIIWVDHTLKKRALLDLIFSIKPGRIIVFVNQKRTADELDDYLYPEKLPCTSMHADRTQREREDSMRAFRSGKSPILITTGVSARGIDVKNVQHVINYDLPSVDHGGITEYTHRIGKWHGNRAQSAANGMNRPYGSYRPSR